MDRIGNSIVKKENLQINLERLAAQKEIYFQAKRLFFLQFFLTVVMTVLLSFAALALSYFGYNIDWFRGAYGIVVVLIDLSFINIFLNHLRQKAASIQELFDCDVLDLGWNKVVVGDKPLIEDIKKYSEKHLLRVGNFDKLKNWYAERIKEVDGVAAKLICQRSNFSYDYSIRKSFLYWMVGISVAILILLILIALFMNMGSRSVVMTILLPFLPILTFSVKLYNEHNTSIKNLESLRSHIFGLWSAVLDGNADNQEATLRQIQDKIYLNRKSNSLIPERFYDFLRPRFERRMESCVDDLVENYRKAQLKP